MPSYSAQRKHPTCGSWLLIIYNFQHRFGRQYDLERVFHSSIVHGISYYFNSYHVPNTNYIYRRRGFAPELKCHQGLGTSRFITPNHMWAPSTCRTSLVHSFSCFPRQLFHTFLFIFQFPSPPPASSVLSAAQAQNLIVILTAPFSLSHPQPISPQIVLALPTKCIQKPTSSYCPSAITLPWKLCKGRKSLF